VFDAPFLDTAAKVEALYYAALGRKPDADELGPAVQHVSKCADPKSGLADVLWALLNSSEFGTNH
jgi:hypothetical protein